MVAAVGSRASWLVIFILCCIMTITMMASVWRRYQETPTMTFIESNHHPILNVPFPAVTVCNTNVVLRSSANIIIEKFVSHEVHREDATKFIRDLPQAFNAMRPFRQLRNKTAVVKAMDSMGYSLETLMFELAQPCGRLLERCFWLGQPFNCSHMFVHLATSEGFCCSFNWHGRALEYASGLEVRKKMIERQWQKRGIFKKLLFVSEAGTSASGLSVVFNTEMEDYFSSINSFLGAAVLIHHPERFPDVGASRVFVQPRFEMSIRISGGFLESANNVRMLSPRQRRCYFQDEVTLRTGKTYSYESCVLDCKLTAYVEKCQCIPFYYPYNPNITPTIPVCDLRNWGCLHRNKGIFSGKDVNQSQQKTRINSETNYCGCLPSCTDFVYEINAQGNKIYSVEYASPDFEGHLDNKSTFSVFFEDNVCIKYRRESQMTWDSLFASFGGILGLYLGGSVVSVIEFIYYIVFKLWQPPPKIPQQFSSKYLTKTRY